MTAEGYSPPSSARSALVIPDDHCGDTAGVATAIYMHEYAPKRSRMVHLVRLAIQIWPAFPRSSSACSAGLLHRVCRPRHGRAFYEGRLVYGQPAIIWPALTLALLTMRPSVVATEEALRGHSRATVSRLLLGATRWQMIRRVVLRRRSGVS